MDNNEFKITGMTVGYIGWYKEHYCLVKVTPTKLIIANENGDIIINKDISNYKNIQECLDYIPNMVIKYITETYLIKGE